MRKEHCVIILLQRTHYQQPEKELLIAEIVKGYLTKQVRLEGINMTCRADEYPKEDFKGNIFKTHCYKCGRKMTIVKGKIKYGDGCGWIDEWIPDLQYWTYKALGNDDEIKVEIEPPKIEGGC